MMRSYVGRISRDSETMFLILIGGLRLRVGPRFGSFDGDLIDVREGLGAGGAFNRFERDLPRP